LNNITPPVSETTPANSLLNSPTDLDAAGACPCQLALHVRLRLDRAQAYPGSNNCLSTMAGSEPGGSVKDPGGFWNCKTAACRGQQDRVGNPGQSSPGGYTQQAARRKSRWATTLQHL